MKIGYVSDTHIDMWERRKMEVSFYLDQECDVIMFAGDASNGLLRFLDLFEFLEDTFGVPVIPVAGNHEYYHETVEAIQAPTIREVGGATVAVATLWTNFRGMPTDSGQVRDICKCITDFHVIQDFTAEECVKRFNEHYEFIQDSKPDIVLTHFPMFLESVSPEYTGHPLNPYFVNDLDPIEGVSLYIHGHTHTPMDYMKGNARVVANPFGYPHENTSDPMCKIEVIEI